MRSIFILFPLFSSALCLQCIAQVSKNLGFVITNEGDTIRGKIEDWGSISSTKSVYIIKNGESKPTAYTPPQARGYDVNGIAYESREILNEKKELQRLFLMPLVTGKMSLYKNGDKFYATRDTLAFNLKISRGVSEKNRLAKGLVKLLVIDCRSINVDSSFIRERYLRDLAIKYNQCKGSLSKEYKTPLRKGAVTFGVIVGEIVSTLNMKNEIQSGPDYRRFSYLAARSFLFGVSADFGMRDSPSFYTELSYFNTNFRGSTSNATISSTSSGEKRYDAGFIRLALGMRLKLRARFAQPYIALGMSQLFTAKLSGVEIATTNGSTSTQNIASLKSSNPQGLWIGLGLQRRFSESFGIKLEGRFEQTSGFVAPMTVIIPSPVSALTSSSTFSNTSLTVSAIF